MTPARPRVHDLLRLRSPALLTGAEGEVRPAWFDPGPTAPVWVVVRRAEAGAGVVAVGVRGASRNERWAATTPETAVVERTPPALVPRRRGRGLPAVAALAAVGPVADQEWPGAWGPAGSVGYELVTGCPVVNAASDLDLVLHADVPPDRSTVSRTLGELRRRAGRVRVDLLIETPVGGFAADEWLSEPPRPLALRTRHGPVLTHDPWAVV